MFNKKIVFGGEKSFEITVLSCFLVLFFVGIGVGFLVGEVVGKNGASKDFSVSLQDNVLFCEDRGELLNFFLDVVGGKVVSKARCLPVELDSKNLTDDEVLEQVLSNVGVR